MFVALTLWIMVLVLEGLAKSVVDPVSYDYERFLINIEDISLLVMICLIMFDQIF